MQFSLSAPLSLMFFAITMTPVVAQQVDFNRDVRPIISNRCLACHGPDDAKREAGLRLDDHDVATKILESGQAAIVPGKSDESELIARITSEDESVRMPPSEFGKPLTPAEIATLKRWVEQGGEYAQHWAYVKPVRAEIPAAPAPYANWPKNAVDNFALHKMLELGMKPTEQADARVLVRRLFLDLIGLPPTVDECDFWVQKLEANVPEGKESPVNDAAHLQLVEHLFQRPEFGEHWARKWLDLARYADSAGYADDPSRTIWPWRDWVIRSINKNMPFDQFTIEQIAGDMLPNATDDQVMATAFHRNTMTNNEGGTQDEEFRNVAVVDRVNTTMAVWMGTTIACAQCHSHKYDPLTQDEYFQLYAILNNTQDADRRDESPLLTFFTNEQKERRTVIESRLAELNTTLANPTDAITASQLQWEQRVQSKPLWFAMKPASVARASGSEASIKDDGTVFVATAAEKDVYTVELPLDLAKTADKGIAAIRLETLPTADLPGGGAGHSGGNFVITELKAQMVPAGQSAPKARIVRIEIPGPQKILSLAEVQVFSAGTNVAMKGKATQSSTDYAGSAEYAIDGNTNGEFEKKSVTHTAVSDNPWWEVDLGSDTEIERLTIWNRTGGGIHERLADFRISLLNEARESIWEQTVAKAPNPSDEYSPSNVRDLKFLTAIADYQQAGFDPEEILDGKTEPENGWAVGGGIADSHALVLVPSSPIVATGPATLRLIIEQNSPYENHVLGSFRISTSNDEVAIERSRLPPNILAIVQKPAADRIPDETSQLAEHFRLNLALELADARKELKTLSTELNGMKPDASVPVLRELAESSRRKTQLQFRGNYLDKGHEVHEGVPAVFPPIPNGEPINRLALGKWLVSDENPLTARVVVNRYWENLFGRGIVLTSEEFGSQGEVPTHPEMLDWLARELVESGWDTRDLLQMIVTSATYRQASKVTPAEIAADLDNRWLARGPRVRLSAEMVRDQSLQVAGLLSRKMYGPPVKPPQPNLGLTAAFGSSTDWQTSMGEDRYRRGIYTTWRRSNPYPSMATFDAPNREVCTLRRNQTNTPLQALVTMNDPVYVEAAQALARTLLLHEGDAKDQIAEGFKRCLLRDPSETEISALVALFNDTHQELATQSDNAMKLATDPLGALPEGMDLTNAAAMTVVCNVLLNVDEMFLKR
jgi:hypothetical protein